MSKKLLPVMAFFVMASYVSAATLGIGTANARGDFRVNGHTVEGNATLLDGTVIETENASTDLRLPHSVRITMSMSSRGTVYRDHFVLQRGESEIAASDSFRFEASGLLVVPSEPDSLGIVSMTSGETVEVAAIAGSFEVHSSAGDLLRSIHPGHALSFAMQAGDSGTSISVVGLISHEKGRYYLTTDANEKYLLIGKSVSKNVGEKLQVSGTLQPRVPGTNEWPSIIVAESTKVNTANAKSKAPVIILITGAVAGAGVGVGYAISNSTSSPASP